VCVEVVRYFEHSVARLQIIQFNFLLTTENCLDLCAWFFIFFGGGRGKQASFLASCQIILFLILFIRKVQYICRLPGFYDSCGLCRD
jgi:hypothetical protein